MLNNSVLTMFCLVLPWPYCTEGQGGTGAYGGLGGDGGYSAAAKAAKYGREFFLNFLSA